MRDCLFCVLYLIFWVAMIVVAIVAFSRGHPHLLAAPFDSAGKLYKYWKKIGLQCGYSEGYGSYPFGYYMPNNYKKFVCIDQCPLTKNSTVNCIWNGTLDPKCTVTGVSPTIRIVNFCFPKAQIIDGYIDLGLGFF